MPLYINPMPTYASYSLSPNVADKKYFYHYIFPPEMPRFALFYALFWISSRVTVFRKL